MRNIWLIIKREYFTRVRKRSFILMSLLGPLLIAGITLFSFWINLEESESQQVIIIDDNYPLFSNIDNSKNIAFFYSELNLEKGLALLDASEQYTALLYIPSNVLRARAGQFYFKKMPSISVQRTIERKAQEIIELHLLEEFQITESNYRRLKSPFYLNTLKFDGLHSEEIDMLPAAVGWIFGIIIFMAVFIYSAQVMRGVIEEKTNRIVEVLVSTIKPIELMMGKIIGVGAVGLTQFFIWGILTTMVYGIGSNVLISNIYTSENVAMKENMTGSLEAEIIEENKINFKELSKDDNILKSITRINFPLMFGLFIFYFLGGYFLYSSMMAAVGSAADNDTETQQFVLPLTMPLLLAYIVSLGMFNNPESDIIIWMSIIPFTSPIIMIMRVAFGIDSGDIWQIYLSMLLLVITLMFMIWISSKVYRTGILMYGKKLNLRDLIRWIKA